MEMDNSNEKITVTLPQLPSLDDFIPYLRDIWDRKWLTNNGHYHQELEKALCAYLKVPCGGMALSPFLWILTR
jgi:dTDP-4-amino-4,6-dideoxygalactose transaminase